MILENSRKPLVSIYLPTHNRAQRVKQAIESVQNQTYRNLEIIVCDDGSTDDTAAVITAMQSSDNRIIYLKNEVPMGACYARNRCIAVAQGEFITGLDDDDYFLDQRIEIFVTTAVRMRKAFLCANMIFKNSTFARKWKSYSGDISLKMMGSKNWVGNQVFVKTQWMKEIGGFDVTFPAWQDYDLWYRMIKRFGPCYRINNATYVVDIENDRPRITTGSKAWQGYQKFIATHQSSLTNKHLDRLYFQDKLNRKDRIVFTDFTAHPTMDNLWIFIKQKIKLTFGLH